MQNNSFANVLKSIISKIGHDVEEIRSRSLDSIIIKLEHGLLHENELLEDDTLAVNLLKWFSFENVTRRRDVLKLLIKLCDKMPVMREQLLRLDAVKFFSQLSQEFRDDSEMEKLVDEILTKLFWLSDLPPNTVDNDTQKCRTVSAVPGTNQIPRVDVPSDQKTENEETRGEEYSGFKMVSLTWVNVHSTDLHILSSTNKSLESQDMPVMSKSIDFLMDVVLNDFPPEIFLQYSQILKNLVSIANRDELQANNLPLKATRCAQSFTRSLFSRINNKQDVSLLTSKKADVDDSSNNVLKVETDADNFRSRGDGSDGDIGANRFVRDLDANFMEGDRSTEISIPQFCTMVFTNTHRLQQSKLSADLIAVMELLHLSCDLLSVCINHNIWNDLSDLGKTMVEQLKLSFETFSASAMFHHNQCQLEVQNLHIHRLAFCSFVNIFIRVLKATNNGKTIANMKLSSSCIECLSTATMDFPIYKYKLELHVAAREQFLSFGTTDLKSIYLNAVRLMDSFNSAMACLSQSEDSNFMEKAEDALECLHYFQYLEFVDAFLKYFTNRFTDSNSSLPSDLERGYKITAALLKYQNVEIRSNVYLKCLSLAKDCFSSMDRSPLRLKIFLNTEVLKSIVEYGFEDVNDEIRSAAKEIIVLLLTNLENDLKKSLLTCISPIFTLLLAYAETFTELGLIIFKLFESSNEHWPIDELLKINLYFLFSKNKTLRAHTTPRLAWLLAKDENALYKIPSLTQLNAAVLSDVFVCHKTPSIFLADRDCSTQNVHLLLKIFLSSSGLLEARLRSGTQLSKVLNDVEMYNKFKAQDGVQQIVELLQLFVSSDCFASESQFKVSLELLALEIFLKSLLHDFDSIKDWLKNSVYFTLLRIALLRHLEEGVLSCISSIFAVLLFRDFIKVKFLRTELTVFVSYRVICDKFELPFRNIEIVSTESPALYNTTIENEHFNTFLRFYYHCATGRSSEKFTLTPLQLQLLKLTEESSNVSKNLTKMVDAKSHTPVIQNLKMLQLEILSKYMISDCSINLDLLEMALERYVASPPKSNADKSLLKCILQFLNFVLHWCPNLVEKLLKKIFRMMLFRNGSFQHLLINIHDSDQPDNVKTNSPLNKEMFKFLVTILSKSSYSSVDIADCLPIFVKFGIQNLNLTDTSQFYNLASLEAVLHCLVHITARPGFSHESGNEPLNVCRELMTLLLDVVAAFHLSREANHSSFMGGGITLSAVVCLSHIAREMSSFNSSQDWISLWFYNYEVQDEGLDWLIPLWTHSEVQIRTASLDIISSFTTSKIGCKTVMSHTRQFAGGLCGVFLNFLLNHSEACIVREMAAVVLTNLTVHLFRDGDSSITAAGNVWHGLIIVYPDLEVPAVGLPGLILLLKRSNFMQEMTALLSNFCSYVYVSSQMFLEPHILKVNEDFSVLEVTDLYVVSQDKNSKLASKPTTAIEDSKMPNPSTCALVKRMCQLLKNLVTISPLDITLQIKSAKIFEQFGRVLEVCKLVLQKSSPVCSVDIVDLLASLIELLATICQTEQSLCFYIINNQLLDSLFDLLDIKLEGIKDVLLMWRSVYTLLIIIVSNVGTAEQSRIVNYVCGKFPLIIGNIERVFACSLYVDNRNVCLMWFVQFLSSANLVDPLSSSSKSIRQVLDSVDTRVSEKEVGYVLSCLLCSMHGSISQCLLTHTDSDVASLIVNTFAALLAVSQSAKLAALEHGIMSSVLDRMNQIVEHCNVNSVDGKLSKKPKNMDILISNVVCYLNLLKNLMHENLAAKISASEIDICAHLLQFWDLALAESKRLLPAFLSFVCTFVSNCPLAANSLCRPCINSTKRPNSCLLNEILKYCQQELFWIGRHSNTENIELAFTVLSTVSCVPTGCSIIIKSKIILLYGESVLAARAKPQQNEPILPSWWLKLFINMTFLKEGREAVINLPGIYDALVNVLNIKGHKEQVGTMMLIRNLCFHQSKKNRLLNSNELLTIVKTCALNNSGDRLQLLSTSALWALLANNRKVKVILKNEEFAHRVEDLVKIMQKTSQDDNQRTLKMLHAVLTILKGRVGGPTDIITVNS